MGGPPTIYENKTARPVFTGAMTNLSAMAGAGDAALALGAHRRKSSVSGVVDLLLAAPISAGARRAVWQQGSCKVAPARSQWLPS